MANAVLRSPTHARKNTKSFKHVSENHGDQSRCANELQTRGDALPSYKNDRCAGKQRAHWNQCDERLDRCVIHSFAGPSTNPRSRCDTAGNVSLTVVPRPISL